MAMTGLPAFLTPQRRSSTDAQNASLSTNFGPNIDATSHRYVLPSQQMHDHSLYIQVQALERENAGLRAKVAALTSVDNYPLGRAKSSTVTREVVGLAEAEVSRLKKQCHHALARKDLYKKHLLNLLSRASEARESLRLVLDVARMHRNVSLLQAVHVVEDAFFSPWVDLEISDYEHEDSTKPPLKLSASGVNILPDYYDSAAISVTSPHSSRLAKVPKTDRVARSDKTDAFTKDSTLEPTSARPAPAPKQRPPKLLPPMDKTNTPMKQKKVSTQTVTEATNHRRDKSVGQAKVLTSNVPLHSSVLTPKRTSAHASDPSHESSYLADSSLWSAVEKKMATEIVQMAQEVYMQQQQQPSASSTFIESLKTPQVLSNTTSEMRAPSPEEELSLPLSVSVHSEAAVSSASIARAPTPAAPTLDSTYITPLESAMESTEESSIDTQALVGVPQQLLGSQVQMKSQSQSRSSMLESTVEVSVTMDSLPASRPLPKTPPRIPPEEPVELAHQSAAPEQEENKPSPESASKSSHLSAPSDASQSLSITSFLCGVNELSSERSIVSNTAEPILIFSPRAEELISFTSLVATSGTQSQIPVSSQADAGSRIIRTKNMPECTESDILVSDVDVMHQTNMQHQVATTRFLESKGADDSSTGSPLPTSTESTGSMGAIIDRSRAAALRNSKQGMSTYLIEAMMARSGDMGITPDAANFLLSRPVTANQSEPAPVQLSLAEALCKSSTVLTMGMLEKTGQAGTKRPSTPRDAANGSHQEPGN